MGSMAESAGSHLWSAAGAECSGASGNARTTGSVRGSTTGGQPWGQQPYRRAHQRHDSAMKRAAQTAAAAARNASRALTDTARAWAKQNCPQWIRKGQRTQRANGINRGGRDGLPATRKAGQREHEGSSGPGATAGGRDNRGARRGSSSRRQGSRQQQIRQRTTGKGTRRLRRCMYCIQACRQAKGGLALVHCVRTAGFPTTPQSRPMGPFRMCSVLPA